MEKLENLTLNKMELDTSMAQEFIKNKVPDEWPENQQFIVIGKENEITKYNIYELISSYFSTDKVENKPVPEPVRGKPPKEDEDNPVHIGNMLAKKIEENTDMFVQLEYLIRGTDERDVREGHVKLMAQLARCNNALWNSTSYRPIVVTENTALYNLAAPAVHSLYRNFGKNCENITPIVVVDKKMMPLCHFFAELCREVGLNIKVLLLNQEDLNNELGSWDEMTWSGLSWSASEETGCTGVIAEWSDLDSALDVFIHSSITAPWKLKQIYVQESVFEDFKSALAAKAQKPADNRTFTVGDKTFLVECLATTQGIPVQAYRTTKELLSLLETPYLTLWAADSAVSNEIALKATAGNIWVNSYGSFDGPPRSALSVYNLKSSKTSHPAKKVDEQKLEALLKSWEKRLPDDRLEIIVAVAREFNLICKSFLPDLTVKWRSDDLIHVTDRTVTLGLQQRVGIIYDVHDDDINKLLRSLKSIVNGNAVIGYFDSHFVHFVCFLNRAGVPILHYVNLELDKEVIRSTPMIMERLKVIRTNYGTIFAN